MSAKLHLKSNTNPVYIKARPVLFSLLGAVEQELDKLVKDGVLDKVNKITVNPYLIIDEHPLHTMEELFDNVAGGDKFSKIDLTRHYPQLEMEEEDCEALTLSTHKVRASTDRRD